MTWSLPKAYYVLIALLFWSLSVWAEIIEVPALKGRVTDLTGTLTATDIQHMESRLRAFEEAKGSQIAVLMLPTTGDETIEQFGIRVADNWKLGREGVDDGIIILVAKNDRKVRIEVGYGLEGAVPDALSKRIITQIILPEFRSGHFAEGIEEGIEAVTKLVNGEELPLPEQHVAVQSTGKHSLGALVILGFFAISFLGSVIKGKKGKVIAFVLVFVLASIFLGFLMGFIIASIATVFSLVSGRGVGRGRYRGGGFYGGGGFGSSGGGSFGGFSGGGGGFGGGGASGSW